MKNNQSRRIGFSSLNPFYDQSHDKANSYIWGIENNIAIEKSVENSELACQENRRAISLSFFASYVYHDFFVTKTALRQFREDIDRTIYYNNVLRKSLPPEDEVRTRLELYSQSELSRRDILQAIIDDDMQKAQKLQLDAMGKAISEDKSLVDVR